MTIFSRKFLPDTAAGVIRFINVDSSPDGARR
jgi:hypothetical protein